MLATSRPDPAGGSLFTIGRGTSPAPSLPADALPPLRLPAQHFAAGVVWLLLGGAGLFVVAPDLAWGRFLGPRVVAVTHCFTLGWITTVVFGALYQIFPVALGVRARSVAAGHGGFVTLTAGAAALVAGSWFWRGWLLATGWILLVAAVGIWSWNLLSRRRHAARGHLLGRDIAVGHAALGLAMLVVAARVGAALGWWNVERLGVLSAHFHLAALGFATVTVLGVSGRLLPRFLVSRDPPQPPLRWVGPLAAGGAAVLALGQLTGVEGLTRLGGAAGAAGVSLYLLGAAVWYRRRALRRLDPGLALATAALAHLALAAGLGLTLLWGSAPAPQRLAAYAIVGLLGWLSLFAVGVSFRILPLLVWTHRFGRRVGEPGVPRVGDLTTGWLAWTSVGLLAAGVPMLAVAVAAGEAGAARAAAAVFGLGLAAVAAHHGRLGLRRVEARAANGSCDSPGRP